MTRLIVLVVLIASLVVVVRGAPSPNGRVQRRQPQLESRAELPSTTSASVAPSSGASQASASATPAPSSSGNSTASASNSGNTTATATNSRNSTSSTNATSTSSTSDRPKPQATDFTAQTLVAPAPAAQGGGRVAQSPDDSYIASAHRNAMFGLSSVIALVGTAAYFTL